MATKVRLPEPDRDFEDKIRNYLNNLVRTLQYTFDQTPTLFPELGDAPSFYETFGGNLVAVASNEQGLAFVSQGLIVASIAERVSSGTGDANKYLKTTGAQAFTWASVIDTDKVSSGSGDANKFFKTTGANAYAWTSINDAATVSAANQSEIEAAVSSSKAKFVPPHGIQFSPFAAKGGLVCDVSARVCSSFGNINGVTRPSRGKYIFTFSPAFASVGGINILPFVQMTSAIVVTGTPDAVKNVYATSLTTNSLDVYTLDGRTSAADQNNERVQLIVYGNI